MRALLDNEQGQGPAMLIGAVFGLVISMRVYLANETPALSTLMLGVVAGLVGLVLFGWLLRNFSRWFGGQSSLKAARTGLGLGLLPWTVLFAAFLQATQMVQDAAVIEGYFSLFFLFFIYGYFVLLMSLSAALNLSVLKTFLCLVVTILVSIFPLTLLMQIFVGAPQ